MPPDRKRILLVENDRDVCDLLSLLLQEAGYDVVAAGCFAEGRVTLEASAFDLLVADVILPGGYGTDLAPLAEERGVPALLMTGNPDRMTLFEGQGVDYLGKPFLPGTFLRAVEARLAPETA